MVQPIDCRDTGGQIHRDHLHLKSQLQQLHESVAAGDLGPVELERELVALEAELEEHFVLEEDGGLFEQIVEAAPELTERIEGILQQHQLFRANFGELRRTCRLACSASGSRDGWLAAFFAFHRQFDEHERAEHDLLHEALHRDLGTGD